MSVLTKEVSFLLVKPDGLAVGLVDEIRILISREELEIIREKELTLPREKVIALYGDLQERDFFDELVHFLSGSRIYLFVVRGTDAVMKVRKIIGKRVPPSGLRELWAKSIVKNVAHGPDSSDEARAQLKIIFGSK